MLWLSYDADGEVGFEGGLIETGEGSSSVRRLELRGCQKPENVLRGILCKAYQCAGK